MFFLTILPYPSHSGKVRVAAALHTGTIVEAGIVLKYALSGGMFFCTLGLPGIAQDTTE
jgi:hypothetical protein